MTLLERLRSCAEFAHGESRHERFDSGYSQGKFKMMADAMIEAANLIQELKEEIADWERREGYDEEPEEPIVEGVSRHNLGRE